MELLEGVIVSMAPHSPQHAAGIRRVFRIIREAVGQRALVQAQLSLIAGRYSVPEPDVAVVPGGESDYETVHPSRALLVVEVAESSLPQDRLTKAAIYAHVGIPEYWIVNLRDDRIEVYRRPRPRARRYTTRSVAVSGDRLTLVALPDVTVAVDDLLPRATR